MHIIMIVLWLAIDFENGWTDESMVLRRTHFTNFNLHRHSLEGRDHSVLPSKMY